MPTNYPAGIDAFSNPEGTNRLNNPDHALQHKNANDAIQAIETELGSRPSGPYSTVRSRLDSLEASISSAAATIASGDAAVAATVSALSSSTTSSMNALTSSVASLNSTVSSHTAATGAAVHGLGTSSTRNVAASGDASSSQVVLGNDTRLTNSRTPTAHTHIASNITDLSTAVSGVSLGGILSGTVGAASFAAGTIGETALATDAVTTAKIRDQAVTTEKLCDDAVTGDKIDDEAISIAHLTFTPALSSDLDNYVAKDGSTMSGRLSIALQPTDDPHVTNKYYVDTEIASKIAAASWGDGSATPPSTGTGFDFGVAYTLRADTTLTNQRFVLADASTQSDGSLSITLPLAAGASPILIRKIDSSSIPVTVQRSGTNQIDGAISYTLTSQYESIILIPSSPNWYVASDSRNAVQPHSDSFHTGANKTAFGSTPIAMYTVTTASNGGSPSRTTLTVSETIGTSLAGSYATVVIGSAESPHTAETKKINSSTSSTIVLDGTLSASFSSPTGVVYVYGGAPTTIGTQPNQTLAAGDGIGIDQISDSTNAQTLIHVRETPIGGLVNRGTVSGSAYVDFRLAKTQLFTVSGSETTTFNFRGATSGKACRVTVMLVGAAAVDVSFNGVNWDGGIPDLSLTNGQVRFFEFITVNGSTVYGFPGSGAHGETHAPGGADDIYSSHWFGGSLIESMSRNSASGMLTTTTNDMHIAYFTAWKTLTTPTKLLAATGSNLSGTNAVRLLLMSVSDTGQLTRLAVSNSITPTANAVIEGTISGVTSLTRGLRYAIGVFQSASSTVFDLRGSLVSTALTGSTLGSFTGLPRLGAKVSTTLTALTAAGGYSEATPGSTNFVPWVAVG